MYSPSFSELAAVSVRRLAWAMNKNMGLAVDLMVLLLPASIKSEKVCAACKDNTKCPACIFKAGKIPPIKSDLLK
jgi:predicted hydrocarbon binding protein